jgi:RND family efflux transporter MFP subunit
MVNMVRFFSPASVVTAVTVLCTSFASAQQSPGLLEGRDVRGQISPKRYTTLAAEIPAKVLTIRPPEGGSFRAGQTLITFDCAMQHSQLEKAQAAFAGAQTTLKANKELAELNSIGIVELRLSESEAGKAKADLKSSETTYSKCRVIAPFSGRVAEQKVREEQFVQTGQPLLDLIDDSVLELEFIAPSQWLEREVNVAVDETGKSYLAKVSRLGARVDPVSQSIKVIAVIDGRPAELMAGMSGRVTLAPTSQNK